MGIGFVFGQLRPVRGGTRGHSSYHGIAPARPSLASLLMSSALALALNSFKVATTQAHASVLAPGQQPGAQALQDFSTMPAAEQKRHLEGSLLELQDGSFAYVPIQRGIVNAGKPDVKFSVRPGTTVAATARSLDWMDQNVKRLIAGVLSLDGKAGAFADRPTIGGIRVGLSIPPGDTISQLSVSVPGAAARSIDIANAIQNAGLVWRPWRGGPEPARLIQSEGLPLLATVRAATIARGHLIPGGSSLMRAAKLETLGLGCWTLV